jgi:hypothetical protein
LIAKEAAIAARVERFRKLLWEWPTGKMAWFFWNQRSPLGGGRCGLPDRGQHCAQQRGLVLGTAGDTGPIPGNIASMTS